LAVLYLITREERLDKIAKDVLAHFVGRGWRGKAKFVVIDKTTAVRMYDKVKKEWAARLKRYVPAYAAPLIIFDATLPWRAE
jgi:type I restriction enzyme R subunit